MKPKLEGADARVQVSNGIVSGMLQRWRMNEHGHIQTMAGPAGSQCCIDIDGKNPAEGARVHLWNAHMPNPAYPPATQQVRASLRVPFAGRTRLSAGLFADVGALGRRLPRVEDARQGLADPGRRGGRLGGRDREPDGRAEAGLALLRGGRVVAPAPNAKNVVGPNRFGLPAECCTTCEKPAVEETAATPFSQACAQPAPRYSA